MAGFGSLISDGLLAGVATCSTEEHNGLANRGLPRATSEWRRAAVSRRMFRDLSKIVGIWTVSQLGTQLFHTFSDKLNARNGNGPRVMGGPHIATY